MNSEFILDIVIPVFNEGENIRKALDEIYLKIKTKNNVLIIYDFKEDNTIPAVEKYVSDNSKKNIFLVMNKYGRGVLNAIKTGLEQVKNNACLVCMGDLSDDLAVVDLMCEKITEGYDIVCGSRYMKGGRQIGGPLLKGFLSRMAGRSLKFFTGIPTHDVSNSFKMYKKSVLENTAIESTGGFEIGLEILVKSFCSGGRVTEVPSIWKDRTGGKSNFKLWKWLPKYLKWYFYLLFCKKKKQ